MNAALAYGDIITTMDCMLKFFLPHLPLRWDDPFERWFKMFCILIRSQTKVYDFGFSER